MKPANDQDHAEIVNRGASWTEKTRVRRHRIVIEQKVEIQDYSGDQWQKVCESWAEIRGEVITVRYQPYILPGMRVVIGRELYEITAVIDKPGKTRLVELHISEFINRASAVLPDAQQR
jgi:head-tail adaptor